MATELTPKYAHLEYKVLHMLNISIPEYFLLEMVYYLSREDWCKKSLDNIAYDMNITRRGVISMRDRLIERKLLIKGTANRLRTSEIVHKVHFLSSEELLKMHLIPEKVQKVHSKSAKSFPKINSRLVINNTTNVVLLAERHGNPEINNMFDIWEKTVGYVITSRVKANRYACSNLIKKHSSENVEKLLRMVKAAQEDQYAPHIADFCDLQKKFNQLILWVKQRSNNQQMVVKV